MNSKLRLEIFDDSNINDVQLKAIYDLNQANYPEVGFLDSNDHLTRLIKFSSYNLIVFKELEIVGFIICMREGCAYQSENYKFFTKRLKKFLYIDRIAIDINHRREGLGKSIYDNIFNIAKIESLPIALEVNIEPTNQPSLDFHAKLGFDRIGEKKFFDHSVAYFLK